LQVAHGPIANGLIPVTIARFALTFAASDIGPKFGRAAINLAFTLAAADSAAEAVAEALADALALADARADALNAAATFALIVPKSAAS